MKVTEKLVLSSIIALCSCGSGGNKQAASVADPVVTGGGQSTVSDDVSQQNVVQIAVGSPDHTTLVTALKTAAYVDVLVNAGPFTVFAPTNAAFDKLPAGTVEDLLKPENKSKLQDILEYHVFVGVIRESIFKDGMRLNQVNSKNVILGNKDGKKTVNGANILGAVTASNGIIYIIDEVLVPEQ